MPLIDFGQLNLPIKVKNLQKSLIRISCTCSAKIEALYDNLGGRLSHEFAIFAKKICIEFLNALH